MCAGDNDFLIRDQFMSQSLLTNLDLSSNLVSKIRVGAFNGLESLVSLSMRSNRIERLGEAVFTGKSQNFVKGLYQSILSASEN